MLRRAASGDGFRLYAIQRTSIQETTLMYGLYRQQERRAVRGGEQSNTTVGIEGGHPKAAPREAMARLHECQGSIFMQWKGGEGGDGEEKRIMTLIG